MVAIVVGMSVGVALFALAGARRTQSSYDRFLGSVDSSDLSFSQNGFEPSLNAQVAALPGVLSSRTYLGLRAVIYVDGTPDPSQFSEGAGSFDGAFFDQDRFVVSRGRVPDAARVDELAVNEIAADRYGYRLGQQLDVGIIHLAALDDPGAAANPADVDRSQMTIVGIGQFPDEVIADDADSAPRLLFTPAFTAGSVAAAFYNLQYLRLEHGESDVAVVQAHLRAVADPGSVDVHRIAVDRVHARRGLRPLSIALTIFGLIAGCVGTALGAMTLVRLQRREAHDAEVMISLGASLSAVRACSLVAPSVGLVAGSVVAIVVSILLSPLMPLGPAANLGGRTGVNVDWPVIGVGVMVSALLCVAVLMFAVVRTDPSRSRHRSRRRPSQLVRGAASIDVSPALQIGVAMTVDDGRTSQGVPMRTVIAGTALAVVTLVVAVGFATNLHELTRSPDAYGWNWDATIRAGQGFGNLDPDQTASILDEDSDVEAWSSVYLGDDLVSGTDTPLLGIAPSAPVRPPILSGRFIATTSEIVLGRSTAAALHADIGDTVTIGAEPDEHRLRVVGIATLPSIGGTHVLHPSLGVGAIVDPQLVPGAGDPANGIGPQLALVKFRDGTDEADALQRLAAITTPLGDVADFDILTTQRPAEIATTASLGNLPIVVAALLATFMALALALALSASIRRRGRELAVLRTLGFSDKQLTSAVAWHSATIVIAGLIIGIPTGVIGSAWLWHAFAQQLDIVPDVQRPTQSIITITAGAAVLAGLTSIVPARTARRLDLAATLGCE